MWLYRLPVALLTATTTLVIALSLWLVPDDRGFGTHEQLGLDPCGYFVSTGKPCLTCGMTTAFALCSRLRWVSAYEANPLAPPLYFLCLAVSILGLRALSGGHPLLNRTTRWILGATALALLVISIFLLARRNSLS
jgi:hypothetical protein